MYEAISQAPTLDFIIFPLPCLLTPDFTQQCNYASNQSRTSVPRQSDVSVRCVYVNRSLRSSTSRSYDDDEETLLLECVRGQSWLDYAPIDIRRAVSSDACGRLRESLARDKWREAAWRAVGLVDGDDGDGGDGDRHHHYNHILFTSRKGVTEFLEAWRELQGGGGGGGLHSVAGPLKVKKKTTKAFMLWALVS